ncbi:MAG TPA: ABC transporter permease [Thermoanaerobaculia bacterium]|nr:ABC transporter permease [Thermoanaerobaculia bacterium]
MLRVETGRLLLPLAAATGFLLLWQLAVAASGTRIFPPPTEVARGLAELFATGVLGPYIWDSLRRVSGGYLAAVASGVPLGMLLGRFPIFGEALNPLVQMLRPISPLAWMPLAVIWFGIGDMAPVFLIFMGALFPILLATMQGVRNIPAMYLQAAENFGLSELATLRRVIFPAILPRVITGLRIALGVAWVVLVASEMIAVDSGLGYLIIDARNAGKRYDLVVGGMLLIGSIGLVLDIMVRRLEQLAVVRWALSDNRSKP